ncbi:class I SAM-dependent methyltransferase [candidate division KSB1 bacterium]|nr:class I SAM-dependent methyltransferase [candidate division KSB1 bacterium]
MLEKLEEINSRPSPFQFYTAEELWNDEHTSKQMLQFHLNESVDISSRNMNFINRSVEWISSYFGINNSTTIADYGCGPGLYAIRLAAKGAKVVGIDFSQRSIEYAQNAAGERKLKIEYVHQNYLTFETDKRFDLITMIMCDFCALSPEQRKSLLNNFHKLLKPDGSILLDVYTFNSFNQREEQALYEFNLLDHFWAFENYYGFLNTFKYDDEKVILDKYTIIEPNRARTIYNWLQYFSQDTLNSEFANNGFKADKFYSDVCGSEFDRNHEEMAIIAKKAI